MFSFLKDIYSTISKKEKIAVNLGIIFLLLLSSWPVIFGYIQQYRTNQIYTGIAFTSYTDRMVYFSQMEEAKNGSGFFSHINVGGNSAGYFSPFWTVLGKFSELTGISSIYTFHLFRLIFGFFLLWLIYLIVSKIFSLVQWRLLTFSVAVFGAGFGIFTISKYFEDGELIGYLGTDIWIPEGYTFYTLMHSPLFVLAQAMLLYIFWWRLERLNKAKAGEMSLIGMLILFLGFIHPYDIVILVLVLSIWQICQIIKEKKILFKEILRLSWIFLIGVLPFGYFYWLSMTDKIFSIWFSNNITMSPNILNYFTGYGLIFIFYLFGIYPAMRSKDIYLRFLAVWSVTAWFAVYLPVQFQRRLLSGMLVPLSIIAVLGFIRVLQFIYEKKPQWRIHRYYFLPYLLCLLFVTNFYILCQDTTHLIKKESYPYLAPYGYDKAFIWIKQNLSLSDMILSNRLSGMLISGYTAKTVYLAHWHQTADSAVKDYFVEEIFFGTNKQDHYKINWLAKENIKYVFFSQQEDDLGDFNPWQKKYLQAVYQNKDVAIFKVIPQ